MSNGGDNGHGSHRRDRQGASDDHLAYYAQQALFGVQYSSSTGPAEAQQHSSAPATSGYVIQQPRPAPYQQGQLEGNTSYGGGYADTAQYSGSLTGEPQPLSGGYSGSALQQTTEEHKRARESSSSSGDQQREHGRSHHRHKKGDHGRGEHHHHSSGGHRHSRHHGSRSGESQGGRRSHQEPRHQPENQGANFTPPAPQYQLNPQQNTSWPTNALATAGYGSGAGRGYGDDVYIPPARSFPPPPRGQLPPMQSGRPQPAPMSSLPRQQRRRDEVPPILPEPPDLLPLEEQPQSGGLPSQEIESQEPAPTQPPEPTGTGAGPAASHSDNNLDPFNVAWQYPGLTFDISRARATRGLTPLQLREMRVLLASFATWDEARELGQELPGGRAPSTVAQAVRRDDGSQSGLRPWREWTRRDDLILWEHRDPPPTEHLGDVAARLQRDYFPERMFGEVLGRLQLFARLDEHPDQAGRTIGAFPTFGFAEKRARQNR